MVADSTMRNVIDIIRLSNFEGIMPVLDTFYAKDRVYRGLSAAQSNVVFVFRAPTIAGSFHNEGLVWVS